MNSCCYILVTLGYVTEIDAFIITRVFPCSEGARTVERHGDEVIAEVMSCHGADYEDAKGNVEALLREWHPELYERLEP